MHQRRVPAQDAGVLRKLIVREGTVVRKGQVLGVIDDRLAAVERKLATSEYEIARLQSESDIDERFAKKSLAVAQSELKRSEEANQRFANSVSKTELERLQLVVDRSTLAIEQAERDIKVANAAKRAKRQTVEAATLRLNRRKITAPIDGTVVELFAQQGEWVEPGDPVVRIIGLNQVRVEAHLDGRRFGRSLEGRTVDLQVTLPPGDRTETFPGRIEFVSPELQPVTGQVRVWAEIENRNFKLRPGDHGQLTIQMRDAESADATK